MCEWGGEMTGETPGRSREILLAAAAILYELPRLLPAGLPGAADDLRAAIASARGLGDGEDREDAIDQVLGILVSAPETRERLNELLPALREERGEQPGSGGAFLAGDPLPMPYDRYACTICTWVWPVLDIGDPEQPPATCANGHSRLEFRAAGG